MSTEIVLATGNAGKVGEIQAVLGPLGFHVTPQTEYAVTEAEETGLTFIENALLKARNAARVTGKPALADDSGLSVDALQGAPGIYSSRYAGLTATDQQNNAKLLEQLQGITQRGAHFYCALALLRHENDPAPLICIGRWDGEIAMSPAGNNGFGYDPLFFLPQKNCTSAELSSEEKHRISHRGQALLQLVNQIEAWKK